MSLRAAWLIGLLALFCASSKCQHDTMKVAFITDQTGLQAVHKDMTPLVEKVYCPSEEQQCQVTRVYPDGALYLQGMLQPGRPQWTYLTQVTPAGLEQLHGMFASVCGVEGQPPAGGRDLGTLTIRWQNDDCGREVTIMGVEYGDYAPLQRLSDVINGNLVPR